ncbi:MAG: cytochrome c4 [Gammaproteobacteria bacterium]|nr:cytochrome c4 [Gammaproteobacteria bacterium]
MLLALITMPSCLYASATDSGQKKANICTECHSIDGTTPDPIVPKLNGQNKDFLYKQTMQYVTGKRFDTVMGKVINKIKPSTEDISDIAAYYASLPIMSGNKILSAEGISGKAIFISKKCNFCHNDADRSVEIQVKKTVVIGGQNKAYLFKSLKDIQEGIRMADAYNLMQRVLKKMTDDEINDVSDYLSTL